MFTVRLILKMHNEFQLQVWLCVFTRSIRFSTVISVTEDELDLFCRRTVSSDYRTFHIMVSWITIPCSLKCVHVFRMDILPQSSGYSEVWNDDKHDTHKGTAPSSGHHGPGDSIFYRKLDNHLPHQ